jgi:hypothetical protein
VGESVREREREWERQSEFDLDISGKMFPTNLFWILDDSEEVLSANCPSRIANSEIIETVCSLQASGSVAYTEHTRAMHDAPVGM